MNAQKPGHDAPSTPSVSKTAEEWKATLTPEQYAVLREHGTEPRGTSPLNKEKRDGVFRCAGCGQELFAAGTKFESGTGWPSFDKALPGAVTTKSDRTYGMTRTEVLCSAVRRASRARVPGWTADHRRALLHERLRHDVRAEGVARQGAGRRASAAPASSPARRSLLLDRLNPARGGGVLEEPLDALACRHGGRLLLTSELGLAPAELRLLLAEDALIVGEAALPLLHLPGRRVQGRGASLGFCRGRVSRAAQRRDRLAQRLARCLEFRGGRGAAGFECRQRALPAPARGRRAWPPSPARPRRRPRSWPPAARPACPAVRRAPPADARARPAGGPARAVPASRSSRDRSGRGRARCRPSHRHGRRGAVRCRRGSAGPPRRRASSRRTPACCHPRGARWCDRRVRCRSSSARVPAARAVAAGEAAASWRGRVAVAAVEVAAADPSRRAPLAVAVAVVVVAPARRRRRRSRLRGRSPHPLRCRSRHPRRRRFRLRPRIRCRPLRRCHLRRRRRRPHRRRCPHRRRRHRLARRRSRAPASTARPAATAVVRSPPRRACCRAAAAFPAGAPRATAAGPAAAAAHRPARGRGRGGATDRDRSTSRVSFSAAASRATTAPRRSRRAGG